MRCRCRSRRSRSRPRAPAAPSSTPTAASGSTIAALSVTSTTRPAGRHPVLAQERAEPPGEVPIEQVARGEVDGHRDRDPPPVPGRRLAQRLRRHLAVERPDQRRLLDRAGRTGREAAARARGAASARAPRPRYAAVEQVHLGLVVQDELARGERPANLAEQPQARRVGSAPYRASRPRCGCRASGRGRARGRPRTSSAGASSACSPSTATPTLASTSTATSSSATGASIAAQGRSAERQRRGRAPRQQQRELVAAEPCGAPPPRAARAAARPLVSTASPFGVAERSVDRAEALEVDQQNDQRLSSPLGAAGTRDLLCELMRFGSPVSWSRRASR